MSDIVRAAGGVLVKGVGSDRRVAIVHRDRYDDWAWPKGKAENGETSIETALREVEEETGVTARIVGSLDTVEYKLSSGRRKQVDFYVMRPIRAPKFRPNKEVDDLKWVSVKDALRRLSYDHDRTLIESSDFKRLCRTGTVHLFRHVHAGSRSKWSGDDHVRPITAKGKRQAKSVGERIAVDGVDRIYASSYERCVQSVEPLSKATDTPIKVLDGLAEGSRPDQVVAEMKRLAGLRVVMCSHGDVIPAVLDQLDRMGVTLHSASGIFDCKKASVWEVTIDGGKPVSASYIPPPT